MQKWNGRTGLYISWSWDIFKNKNENSLSLIYWTKERMRARN